MRLRPHTYRRLMYVACWLPFYQFLVTKASISNKENFSVTIKLNSRFFLILLIIKELNPPAQFEIQCLKELLPMYNAYSNLTNECCLKDRQVFDFLDKEKMKRERLYDRNEKKKKIEACEHPMITKRIETSNDETIIKFKDIFDSQSSRLFFNDDLNLFFIFWK